MLNGASGELGRKNCIGSTSILEREEFHTIEGQLTDELIRVPSSESVGLQWAMLRDGVLGQMLKLWSSFSGNMQRLDRSLLGVSTCTSLHRRYWRGWEKVGWDVPRLPRMGDARVFGGEKRRSEGN